MAAAHHRGDAVGGEHRFAVLILRMSEVKRRATKQRMTRESQKTSMVIDGRGGAKYAWDALFAAALVFVIIRSDARACLGHCDVV